MNDKRQKNQLELAFPAEGRGEAPSAAGKGTESFTAECGIESPARDEQLMEEVCETENLSGHTDESKRTEVVRERTG